MGATSGGAPSAAIVLGVYRRLGFGRYSTHLVHAGT